MKERRSASGQILLITLLVLALATTVALALISRTTTDVNVSTQVEESSRAFSAAEAGIEEALRLGNPPIPFTMSSGASYDVQHSDIGGGSATIYEFPKIITPGDVGTLWLTTHNGQDVAIPSPGNYGYADLTLCWVRTTGTEAALEAVIYYINSGGTYRAQRIALDATAGTRGNNFISGVGGACAGIPHGGATARSYVVHLADWGITYTTDRLLMVRMKPLYGPAWIGAYSAGGFPKQGNIFNSCGSTGAGIERCITAYQLYRAPLAIFDYALYSQTGGL